MGNEIIPECKATPHPDAVASGTCPAPSADPTPWPEPPTTTTQTVQPVETPAHPDSDTLPQTGFDLGWFVLGVVVCTLGLIALAWSRLRPGIRRHH